MHTQKIYPALFFVLALLFSNPAIAQFKNSWISFSNEYLKIGVKEEGIYHLTKTQLEESGFPVKESDFSKLQMFHRGKEVSINISDDYTITFYGVANDGATDSLLYRPTTGRLNKHYSFFSDESFYFLTVGQSSSIKRAEKIKEAVDLNITPETWHWASKLITFPEEHTHFLGGVETPSIMQSYFTNEETVASTPKVGTSVFKQSFDIEGLYTGTFISPKLEVVLNGRKKSSNSVKLTVGNNNRLINTFNISGFRGSKYYFDSFTSNDISSNNKFNVSFQSNNADGRYSIAYIHLQYPQKFIVNQEGHTKYILNKNNSHIKRIQFELSEDSNYNLWDISDPNNVKIIETTRPNGKVNAMVPSSADKEQKLILTNHLLKANSLESFKPRKITPEDYNYLIVTNSTLLPAAENYAQYRQSTQGGNYKTLIADITEIYNQFNYGEPSPVAIKEFVNYMVSDKNWNKYLLLIGHTTTMPLRYTKGLKGVADANANFADYWQIPSIGYPGSDLLLVDGLGEDKKTNIPGIPIGRIPALNQNQVLSYLEKVQEYESDSPNISWKKRILHMNGGKSNSELNSLKAELKKLEPIVNSSYVGGYVEALSKQTLNPVDKADISSQVNNGVGMITYFGHGSATTTDFNMGYASAIDNNYQNKGKYPFLYFNGCGVGNIFSGRYDTSLGTFWQFALSTDWILSPQKGAIAVLANSYDSYLSTSSRYLNNLYSFLYNNNEGLTIGQIQKQVAIKLSGESLNEYDIANLHQSVLQGDPALKLLIVPHPDFAIERASDMFLQAVSANEIIGTDPALRLGIGITNHGANNDNESVAVNVTINYANGEISNSSFELQNVIYKDTLYVPVDNYNSSPIQAIKVTIDPQNLIVELNENNNTRNFNIDWEAARDQVFYSSEEFEDKLSPNLNVLVDQRLIKNGESVSSNPEIKITIQDNLNLDFDINLLEVNYKSCNTCPYEKVNFGQTEYKIIEVNTQKAEVIFNLNLQNSGNYDLLVQAKDIAGNIALPYSISFTVPDFDYSMVSLIVSPNPASSYVRFETSVINQNSDTVKELSSIEYELYDLNGNSVIKYYDKNPNTLNNRWYWEPSIPGMYFYKITCHMSDQQSLIYRGKVIVQK